jgi:hypothetical protein
MKTELKRRDFVTKCFMAGIGCCAFAYGNSLNAQDPVQKPDLKSLAFCGLKCSPECILYKASLENDIPGKKKAYEEFRVKERYNLDFDPDKIFCFTCKGKDKPLSPVTKSCTVRKCAIEKGYDCCIECPGLTICDKELWKSFPKFWQKVIEMQKGYLST